MQRLLSRLPILVLFGTGLLVSQAVVRAEDSGDQAVLRRWAVIASPTVTRSGLPDLLSVALSDLSALELVERQQLDAVMRELQVAAFGEAAAGGKRLQLGQTFKADALLFLSLQPPTTGPTDQGAAEVLQVVVAESRSGTRLAVEYFPYHRDWLEELAESCTQVVNRTRRRFAQGVKQTVCVSQFLSKNLVHDHDHLQSGYASLLAEVLTTFPGVAVVEIDEARSIARELQLAGTKLSDRNVPLMVAGEFEISTPETVDAEPRIRMAVELARAERVIDRLLLEDHPLTQVAEWLRGPLASAIVRQTSSIDGFRLTGEQQRKALLQRAEMFARVGGFEPSASLREAALLLGPDDVDQRLLLISEYCRGRLARSRRVWAQLVSSRSDTTPRAEDDATWAAAHDEHMAVLPIIGHHIEDLIFRRQVSPREADRLLVWFQEAIGKTNHVRYGQRISRGRDLLEAFAWRVLPLFHTLDPELRGGRLHPTLLPQYLGAPPPNESWPAERQAQAWTKTAVRLFTVQLPMLRPGGANLKSDPQSILNDLQRFLEQIPTGPLPIEEMAPLTMGYQAFDLQGMLRMRRVTVDQLCDFYQRLGASDHAWNRFYARCGLLSLAVIGYPRAAPDRPPAEELAELRAYLELRASSEAALPIREHYERSFAVIGQLIQRRADPQSRVASQHGRSESNVKNPFQVLPERIAFEALPGTFPWEHLVPCGDGLDLAWTRQEVVLIPEPLRPSLLHRSRQPEEEVAQAHWDGRFVWVITMDRGVRVFDTQGNEVTHFAPADVTEGKHAIADLDSGDVPKVRQPPYDRLHRQSLFDSPLRLHPIGAGRSVLIGRYGPHKRLWFAEAVVGESEGETAPSVRIFHTCTRIGANQMASDDDPEQIFGIYWVTEMEQAEGADRLLLIGRRPDNVRWDVGRRPLAIDLESFDVSVFPARFPPFTLAYFPHYSYDGRMLYVAKHRLNVFTPDPNRSNAWRLETHLNADRRQSKLRDTILNYSGFLYLPGEQWWRIDRSTWQVETLTPDPLPDSMHFTRYAVSAHHGLIAWHPRQSLHRVKIDSRLQP